MAKQAKAQNGGGASATSGNGFDKTKVMGFVSEIEVEQAAIDKIMDAAREACVPHREEIDKVKERAHDAGLPKRELNSIISKRKYLRKAEGVRAKLNEEQQNNFDQLEQALGMLVDTPLGAAAMAASSGAAGAPAGNA